MQWQARMRRVVESSATARLQVLVAVVTLLVGGLLSVLAARAVARADVEREHALLEHETAIVASRVERHAAQAINALEAVRPLWMLQSDPTRAQFDTFIDGGFAERADGAVTYNGLATIAFIRALRPGEASDFVAHRRAERPQDYTSDLDDATPHYVVDYSTSPDSIGTDVYPLAQRRHALERARDTGTAIATPWVDRLVDLDKPPGERRTASTLYVPVYAGEVPPIYAQARRDRLVGWLAAVTPVESLLVQSTANLQVGVALYDGAGTNGRPVALRDHPGADAPHQASVVDVAGRQWTLDVALLPGTRTGSLVTRWAVLAAGLLLTTSITAALWMLIRSRAEAEQRASTATARMRVSDRSLRVLAEHLPIGVVDLGADGRARWANSQALEMLGLTRLDTSQLDDLSRFVAGDELPDARDQLQRSVTAGEAVYVRHRMRSTDGTERWVERKSAPVFDERDQLVRIVLSINDITAHLELQDALRQARDAALHASRLKSEFLANMSHEIRTPLNGVIGMANLLLDGQLASEQRSRVITLRTAAHQLLELLNDILDLSKIESGRFQLETTSFDLTDVIGQVLRLHTSTAYDRGLAFTSDISPDIPGIVVGDPLRIRQVLDNLIGNAVKFTEHGGVHFRATTHHVGAGRVAVQFEVRDTGVGIPAAAQAEIFRPFTQADTSTTRQFGGTGLGLSICAQLAELMGGELSVSSVVGEGSSFVFAVELGVERWEPLERLPVGSADAGAPPGARPGRQQRKLRLLLVEDNIINQQVALGLLAKLGHAVDVANDGAEAIAAVDAAGDRGYDAILMDCQMPGMDGYEATRRIRMGEPEGRHTPIIALTAAAMKGDRDRCIAAGMDDYLSKPVSAAALDETLLRCVSGDAPANGDSPVPRSVPALAPPPVIDWTTVQELATVGDLFQRSCERFIADVPQEISELRSALARDEFVRAGKVAHKLKGSAATIGVARLAAHLSQLEAACTEAAAATQVLQAATALMGGVDDLFDEAKRALLDAASRPPIAATSSDASA